MKATVYGGVTFGAVFCSSTGSVARMTPLCSLCDLKLFRAALYFLCLQYESPQYGMVIATVCQVNRLLSRGLSASGVWSHSHLRAAQI